jgi:hypothetical protein
MTTSVSSQKKWELTLILIIGVIHFMLWTLNRISNRWIDRRWRIGRRLRSRDSSCSWLRCQWPHAEQNKSLRDKDARPHYLTIWVNIWTVCAPRLLRFEISSYKVWPRRTAHLEDMTVVPLNPISSTHTPLSWLVHITAAEYGF